MVLTQSDNLIQISFKYHPSLIAKVRSLSGRVYDPKHKVWTIPLQGSEKSLMRLAEWGFKLEGDLADALARENVLNLEIETLAGADSAEFESPLPLMPYQKVGAQFLDRIGSGLLGDEVGLGKTVQTLAILEKAKPAKVLVFGPAILKHQWANEIKKFTGLQSIVIEGNAKEREALWAQDSTVYVANYELLLRDFAHMNAREWDFIVADEATKISNPYAKQSKAIKKLRAKRRIALTGTPISNRANEIWNIIDWTNPGVLGNYFQFIEKYCIKNQFGGIFKYQNLDDLQARLKRFMIRRIKSDVLKELPEKIISDVVFPLSEEEQTLYTNIKKEILFEIQKSDISKMGNSMSIQNTLVKMLRLKQLTGSTELLGENTKSSKLEVLKEILTELDISV